MDNFWRLTAALAGILIGGTAACLPLYYWHLQRFVRSRLFIKCVMWLPIFVILSLAAYAPPWGGVLLASLCLAAALYEFIRTARHITQAWWYMVFFCLITIGFVCVFSLLPHRYTATVVFVGVSSALSDVAAFFMGTYLSRHHLPAWINRAKSYEGVFGQIIGGGLGALLVIGAYGASLPWWFGLIIGVASACGDIANSIAKRQVSIKEWGQTIPGHGGVLDRCCSLFTAFAVVLPLLLFT